MPFTVKINVALREQICQKIGSEKVKRVRTSFKEYLNLETFICQGFCFCLYSVTVGVQKELF